MKFLRSCFADASALGFATIRKPCRSRFKQEGFWHPMDTSGKEMLEDMAERGSMKRLRQVPVGRREETGDGPLSGKGA